ncbi:C-C motif chemokine 3-like [Ochotona princeps]|uniref:C-C motif chemokine 3-like n=1 Tax=Ochotona princeps TaxID=9978 RepID=UPI0027153BA7|nr:C-C motif chemokine 3-like [Ochotona princeps]
MVPDTLSMAYSWASCRPPRPVATANSSVLFQFFLTLDSGYPELQDWLLFPTVTRNLSVLPLLVGANTPTACCFLYISRQIPCKFVNDYYETSSQCYKPGIIFQTKRDCQVCADPSETWVQEYISELEMNA